MKIFLKFIQFLFYISFIAIIVFFSLRYFNYYKVTFVIDDVANTKLVKKGEVLKELDEPEKEGYTFLYWMDDSIIIGDDYEVNYDAVLLAVFEQKVDSESYYVSFDSDGGTLIEGQMINKGNIVSEPVAPIKNGYVFKEWQLNGKTYNFNTPIDNDIVLKATYIKKSDKSYLVTFNTNGGSKVSNKYVAVNNPVKKPTNPVKKDYVFKEWQLNGKTYNFNTKVTSNITLDAVYTADTRQIYTISFDTKGGTTIASQKVRRGEKVKIPANPTKSGYKFSNWVYSSKIYDFDTKVTSDMVLTAAYNKINNTTQNNNKIIREYKSDTLRYWIEDKGTYAITHVWVKNAYNQFKVGVQEPFPMLATANSIMNNVSKNKKYTNKEMIGINASGIVSDYFNAETAKKMPEWKNSSKSSVVIVDGVVKRNFTNLKIPNIYAITFGLKKNGYLDYYRLNNYNDVNKNVTNYKKLINDGVKYTFAFAPLLIHNGKMATSLTHDNNIRQALGQIDQHNFIIITTTTTNRSKGLSLSSLATIMKDLKCVEAYNLDGGGSTNLVYKPKGSSTSKSIVHTTRTVADIVYFVE